MECPRCAGARIDDQLVTGIRRGITVGGKRLRPQTEMSITSVSSSARKRFIA